MPPIEKIIEKMKVAPNTIRPEELEKVLLGYGYKFARQKGSHRHYINQDGDVITIPQKNPIKRDYVKEALERIGIK